MDIIQTDHSRISDVDFDNLGFGDVFSDHVFSLAYKVGCTYNFGRCYQTGSLLWPKRRFDSSAGPG